jgi:hypothetical protein
MLLPFAAVVFPLLPALLPALKVLLPALTVLLSVLAMAMLVLGVGVAFAELDELVIGGGGKPGVTVNSSRLRAFPLPCEPLKLMVMVLLP